MKKQSNQPQSGAGEKDPIYFYLLSEMETMQGNRTQAIERLDQAIALDQNNPYLLSKRASQHASLGDLKKAEEDLHQALEKDPNNLSSLLLLGRIEQAQDKDSMATVTFEKALQVNPSSEEAHSLLIEIDVANKNYKAALKLIRSWKKQDPENLLPLLYEATLYENFLASPTKAIQILKQVLGADPENTRALEALEGIKLKLAVADYDHHRYDQAIQKFQELLKLRPDNDRLNYYLGVIQENLKKDTEAREQFEKIPPVSGFYKEARLHLAFMKVREGKKSEAIQLLTDFIQQHPETPSFYEYQAEIYRDQGETIKALEILKQGLSQSKTPEAKESLQYALGMTYEKLGQSDKGLSAMQEVLKLNPQNAYAMNYIGYTYADQKIHLDQAIELLQKAILLKPKDGYILDSLGWAYFQKGDLEMAAQHLAKAYQLTPREPTIAEHLGDLYLKKQEPRKAQHYFAEALKDREKQALDKKENNQKEILELKEKLSSIPAP
ncbi:MAG: tetratricopeptide repeat protein [Deltaproteobacteria bacterium]|nr:tetratricopeptide repeat protein [Deltaproteobacteria bacterium]